MDPASFSLVIAALNGALIGAALGALSGLLGIRCRPASDSSRPSRGEVVTNAAASPLKRLLIDKEIKSDEMESEEATVVDDAPSPQFEAQWQERDFVDLLRRLVSEARYLQHFPNSGALEERRAAEVVMDELACFERPWGPLIVERLEFVPGRTNLKITYPGQGDGTIGLVGAHFDVPQVPPKSSSSRSGVGCWGGSSETDPFVLKRKGDWLYGCGAAGCLSHIALLTQLLSELSRNQPKLQRSIVVVFFAAQQGGEGGVGADMLLHSNRLCELKNGPVFWFDAGGSRPCCGTVGSLGWTLHARGDSAPSASRPPGCQINSIQLAAEAVDRIQQTFDEQFPHKDEHQTGFSSGSTMKPLRITSHQGEPPAAIASQMGRRTMAQGLVRNQTAAKQAGKSGPSHEVCTYTEVCGDIRVTPFWPIHEVMKVVDDAVAKFNRDLHNSSSSSRQKFEMEPERDTIDDADHVWLIWNGQRRPAPQESPLASWALGPWSPRISHRGLFVGGSMSEVAASVPGIQKKSHARDLAKDLEGVWIDGDTLGGRVLSHAFSKVCGESRPFTIAGPIPHIRRFQDEGFDVHLLGFGDIEQQRADNEYCRIGSMQKGFEVVLTLIKLLESDGCSLQVPPQGDGAPAVGAKDSIRAVSSSAPCLKSTTQQSGSPQPSTLTLSLLDGHQDGWSSVMSFRLVEEAHSSNTPFIASVPEGTAHRGVGPLDESSAEVPTLSSISSAPQSPQSVSMLSGCMEHEGGAFEEQMTCDTDKSQSRSRLQGNSTASAPARSRNGIKDVCHGDSEDSATPELPTLPLPARGSSTESKDMGSRWLQDLARTKDAMISKVSRSSGASSTSSREGASSPINKEGTVSPQNKEGTWSPSNKEGTASLGLKDGASSPSYGSNGTPEEEAVALLEWHEEEEHPNEIDAEPAGAECSKDAFDGFSSTAENAEDTAGVQEIKALGSPRRDVVPLPPLDVVHSWKSYFGRHSCAFAACFSRQDETQETKYVDNGDLMRRGRSV